MDKESAIYHIYLMSKNWRILISFIFLAAIGILSYRALHKGHQAESLHAIPSNESKQKPRPYYDISSLTLRPLSYADAFKYFDSASVTNGILSGVYDTTIKNSKTYIIQPGKLNLPEIDHQNAVRYIKSARDYLYRLIPIEHARWQISDSLDRENYDTIIQRLTRLEYAGNCTEHAIITKRMLQDSFTTIVYTLKRDSNQLIDHVIDLIYYKMNGVVYAVTVDAMTGIIGPVKANGEHYKIDELRYIATNLDYPADLKTKRYTIDTLRAFSNVNSKMATEYYTCNGFIYYEGYDDMYILAPKEPLKDKMPRKKFDELYAKVLADVLLNHGPNDIKVYR